MESQVANTIVYSLIAAAAVVIGIYTVLANEKWALRNSTYFISFSAGVILAVAFMHIMPEALEMSGNLIFTVVLFTLIAFYVFEHALAIHTCREDECEVTVHTMGTLAFAGIFIHSLLDGVIIGIGFEADFSVGIAATAAILLHKLPIGITITAIFLHSGFSRGKTVTMAWLVALATPIGALLALYFLRGVSVYTLGLLLAFSTGSLIYVGASDMLPETHKNLGKSNIVFVLLGVGLVYITTHFVGGH